MHQLGEDDNVTVKFSNFTNFSHCVFPIGVWVGTHFDGFGKKKFWELEDIIIIFYLLKKTMTTSF